LPPLAITASENDDGRRLDRILRKSFTDFPLSLIARLLRGGKVTVDGRACSGGYRVHSGETIVVHGAGREGGLYTEQPADAGAFPAAFSLNIVYEDGDFLVINKPKGLLTHAPDKGGAARTHNGDVRTLSEAVSAYLSGKIAPSLSFRPGPLHRLDRNTRGLIVFGKSLKGARFFSDALREGRVRKFYHALVDGHVSREEVWDDLLIRDGRAKKTGGADTALGKRAVTRVRPLQQQDIRTVIEAEIMTGRTHQIRAQCALHGHPLSGDRKYGGSFRAGGYELRAVRIVVEPGKAHAGHFNAPFVWELGQP
jgi:23S rRNA pseudouridine955/2504/2580 synthase